MCDKENNNSRSCCCNVKRCSLQPTIYDGTQDWETYNMQFEAVSTFNEWEPETKTCALVASLRGEAINVLYSLERGELKDYEKVTSTLANRFGKAHLIQQLRADLQDKRVRQGEGVSLQKFLADLTRVVRLAYPERSLAQLEPIRLFSFVNGIECYGIFEDWLEMMLAIFNGRVRTTEEMLQFALEREQQLKYEEPLSTHTIE